MIGTELEPKRQEIMVNKEEGSMVWRMKNLVEGDSLWYFDKQEQVLIYEIYSLFG